MTYKLKLDFDSTNYYISYEDEGVSLSIPPNPANSDYQQFIQDVAEQGIEIGAVPDWVQIYSLNN